MNSNQVFIGNIRRCTKYETHITFGSQTYINNDCISCDSLGYIEEESENFKENAILIEVSKGGYVDIESYKTALDYFKIRQNLQKSRFHLGNLIMSTSPHKTGCLYIDSTTLKPFYDKEESHNVSIHRLKKELKSSPFQQKM